MFDKFRLKKVLIQYKKDFLPKHWKDEKYKRKNNKDKEYKRNNKDNNSQ